MTELDKIELHLGHGDHLGSERRVVLPQGPWCYPTLAAHLGEESNPDSVIRIGNCIPLRRTDDIT